LSGTFSNKFDIFAVQADRLS